jgi:hypothetical protein
LAAFNKRQESSGFGGEGWAIGLVVGWIVSLVTACVAFFDLPNTITAILNPQFWALQKLLGR